MAEPHDGKFKLQVTLAIGLPDHTWIEKTVTFDSNVEEFDDDDYPIHERAFDHLAKTEEEWLNKVAPSFWTTIHYEILIDH